MRSLTDLSIEIISLNMYLCGKSNEKERSLLTVL